MSVQVFEGDGVDRSLLPGKRQGYLIKQTLPHALYPWLGREQEWHQHAIDCLPFTSATEAIDGMKGWEMLYGIRVGIDWDVVPLDSDS